MGQNFGDGPLFNPLVVNSIREYLKIWNIVVRASSQTKSYPNVVFLLESIVLGKNKKMFLGDKAKLFTHRIILIYIAQSLYFKDLACFLSQK